MADTDEFEHSPYYSARYPPGWRRAGEDIAYGSGYGNHITTIERLFESLSNSPGHYANMTNSGYTHIGIGVFIDGDSRMWVPQNFAEYRPSGHGVC